MFAISGDTQLLPTNTIYKALHLYDTWTKIGPKGAFYVRTASKWFDAISFSDKVEKAAISFLQKLTGKKF